MKWAFTLNSLNNLFRASCVLCFRCPVCCSLLTLSIIEKQIHDFFFNPLLFLTEIFEKALNAGFIQATDYVEIWQAYLDYLRRRVDFTQGTYDMFE